MNKLKGKISEIKSQGTLSVVEVNLGEVIFRAIIIDTPDTSPYLSKDNEVFMLFKETEVILGKENPQLSIENQIDSVVAGIEKGKLLSRVVLSSGDHDITAIITTDALSDMGLSPGDPIRAFVKSNEIMISD